MLSNIIQPLIAVASLVAVAWALGRRCLPLVGEVPALRESARTIFGLGLIASGLFFLGLIPGGYSPVGLLAFLVIAGLVGKWHRSEPLTQRPGWRGLALLALAIQPALLLALYPPWSFDATLYHLPFVTAFLEADGLVLSPRLRYPVLPQLVEVLAVPLATFGGETAPALLSTAAIALVAIGLFGFCSSAAGGSERLGSLAAAVWLGFPLVHSLGSQLMVEPLLTAFLFFAMVAAWRLCGPRASRDWAVVGGATLGFAAGCKYLALFFFAMVPAIGLLVSGKRRLVLAMALLAALVASPWYLRLVIETGNPLFPFATGFFGSSPWGQELGPPEHSFKTFGEALERLPELPLAVFELLVGGSYVSRAPVLNPWLVCLPLICLWWRRPTRRSALFAGLIILYLGLWIFLPWDPRFLMPIIPWLSLALAIGIDKLLPSLLSKSGSMPWQRWAHRQSLITGILALLFLLPGWGVSNLRATRLGLPPMNADGKSEFLGLRVDGYRTLESWSQMAAPGDIYLLERENLHYYTDGRGQGDHFGPLAYRHLLPLLRQPCALADQLSRHDIDFLLIHQQRAGWDLRPCFTRVPAQGPDILWRRLEAR